MSYLSEAAPQAVKRKKVTVGTLRVKKRKQKPITMLTAYDYSSALLADRAGVDMILVGDSLAQVMLGMDDTVSLTLDEMLHHCRAVARGARYALTVGDMPFMTYQIDPKEAVRNAGRIMKEGRMEAVKLEGGAEIAETARAITNAGIPVVGHVGFTPQSVSQLGGYRIQGKSADSAYKLYQDSLALQEAGCIAIVLELVPTKIAELISKNLTTPTIGIGAGVHCDGQVLVYHDVLGILDGHPKRFLKQYANLSTTITDALGNYIADVKNRQFPTDEHGYPVDAHVAAELQKCIEDPEGYLYDQALSEPY